jgi:hypothetical protein
VLEHFDAASRIDRAQPLCRDPVDHAAARCGADLAPRRPVDGQGGQPFLPARPHQAVDERVRRRMIRLPWRSEDRRGR